MLTVGTKIGAYTIDGVIGRGGMGEVYRASQAPLGRVVALKLLAPDLSNDDEFRVRFRREATLLASLEHPNIVPMYEASESDRGLYIAMRLIPGPNLKGLIRAAEVNPERAVTLLRGVSRALDAAHAHRLIHRDVKPANILVDDDHAYLADFGLTKAVGVESITKSDRLLGTLDYMAPEQILGAEIDARSDIYSLGAVLYECLTGEVPFPRKTDVAVMYAQLEQQPPSVRALRPELPGSIDEVIQAAMAKRVAERPQSAVEVVDAAASALEHKAGVSTVTAITRPMRMSKKPARVRQLLGRGRVVSGALAAAVAVTVGLVAGESGHAAVREPILSHPLKASFGTVNVPRTWVELPAGNLIPALFSLRSPPRNAPAAVGARPSQVPDAGALFGRWPAEGPDLLPGDFRAFAKLGGGGTPVHLNGFEALSYTGIVSKNGRRRIELFLIPTTRLVVTIACYAPAHGTDGGAIEQCPRIAETIRITRGAAFGLGPRPAYRDLLNRVLGNLLTHQHRLDRALLQADTAASQSGIAAKLAVAYDSAASHLSHLPIGTLSPAEVGIHFHIRDSLRGVGQAWAALAAAARRHSPTDWSTAAHGVQSAVTTLGLSLDELTKLGYTVS